jgi:hypothetical protein
MLKILRTILDSIVNTIGGGGGSKYSFKDQYVTCGFGIYNYIKGGSIFIKILLIKFHNRFASTTQELLRKSS